jgi:hypothetical protein
LSIKPVWRWGVSTRGAVAVLKILYPFLRIKKERAKVALKIQFRIDRYKKPAITKGEFFIRERMRLKLKALNGRGKFLESPKQKKRVYDYLKRFQAEHPNAGKDHATT